MRRPKFRQIPYDLYEALQQMPSGAVLRVLLVIADYTLGFQRSDAPISLTQFEKKTRLSRRGVTIALKKAERLKMIRVTRRGTNPRAGNIYGIEDVDSWDVHWWGLCGHDKRPSASEKRCLVD